MGKVKLNKDGFKGLFINHVEKMVLGVVLLVFGGFVYTSLGLEGLPSDQTPDVLIKSAQNAETSIINPENSKAVMAAVTVSTGYVGRAKEALIPTDAMLYAAAKPPTPVWSQDGAKRQDPKLLPPEKPEVYSIVGPVGYFPNPKKPVEDLLAKKNNSVAAPKVEPKQVAAKKQRGGGSGGMSSSAMGMADMASGGALGGMSGMAGMPGMDAGMGMGMGGMSDTGASGTGIFANPMDRIGFVAQQGTVVKSRSCIAVKFLVPWKKQWEEYDQKFTTALGFNPVRDTPRYISFSAQRLEVSDDPQAPLDWTKATKLWTKKIQDEMNNEGFVAWAPEIADPRYLYVGYMTFPLPPFINRDLEPLAVHTDVPKMSASMLAMTSGAEEAAKEAAKKKKKGAKDKAAEESDAPVAALPNGMSPDSGGMGMGAMGGAGATMGSAMGGGMMGGGMMGGMSGMSGMAGMAGMDDAGGGALGMGSSGGFTEGGRGMGMGMGMGMDDMMGSGMGGMVDPNTVRGPAVPYMLIRFFDFSAEPGKKYRYRIQAILEDPNHPENFQFDPSDRFLDETVKMRLANTLTKENTERANKGPAWVRSDYWLRTDWSEPSAPVSVEIKTRALAGKIAPVKLGPAPDVIPNVKEKMIADEPEAKIMSVVWDPEYAADVTGISKVFRGTFLNYKANGDAIHPVMLVFKLLENYEFQTNRLVADIRGGEELAGVEKDTVLSPGQYALIDENGQLTVRNEFDDWDEYRKLAIPESAVAPVVPDAGSMMGDDGMEGMMPGMGKKGKSRSGK